MIFYDILFFSLVLHKFYTKKYLFNIFMNKPYSTNDLFYINILKV